jgi:type VI secretion system protein ImpH
MALLGVSSPLPNYFSDYLARHPDNAAALADFCALFNHRIHALFYEALRKYHFPAAVHAPGLMDRLCCLRGLTHPDTPVARRLLAFSGVLSTRRRSARGLETMLSGYLGGIPVTVTQWVRRRIPVPNPARLGGDARLGTNTVIGTEMIDFGAKFRVSLGPLPRERFETFLEGTENHAVVKQIIALYTADPLPFDIEVKLAAGDLVGVVLGRDNARLGQTSALGNASGAGPCGEYAVIVSGID